MGLWHGIIACIAFVIGLFSDGVEIYERANSGAWYDLGFLIGVGLFSGSGHKSHKTWRESKGWSWQGPKKSGSAKVTVDVSWTGEDEDEPEGGDEGRG
jgi:hypothetical protein